MQKEKSLRFPLQANREDSGVDLVGAGHFGSWQYNTDVISVRHHPIDDPTMNIGFRCVLVGS